MIRNRDSGDGDGQPSNSAFDGRDLRGRFTPGNKASAGNAGNRRIGELRALLFAASTKTAVRRVVRATINAASKGDTSAAKLLFSYWFGRSPEVDSMTRAEMGAEVGILLRVLERYVEPADFRRLAADLRAVGTGIEG